MRPPEPSRPPPPGTGSSLRPAAGHRDAPLSALVSVHDLMPGTLADCRCAIGLIERADLAPITLLVVPGRDWTRADIAELRAFEAAGHRLAGHGWCHAIERFGGLGHRLHGLFLSRRVAEHLALDADGISHLMQRCYDWFGDNGLAAPTLYVPPAWALGRISIERLAAECPFACVERFDGMLVPRQHRAYRLPLLGYEADTPLRAPVLWLWNVLNRRAARRCGRALRIGIHPRDPALALGKALIRDLHRPWRTLDTDQWLAEASTPR